MLISKGAYFWLVVAISLLLSSISPLISNLSYVILAIYALQGKSNAILAICISWVLTLGSPGIFASASFASLGKYLILFCALLCVILKNKSVIDKGASRLPLLLTFLFSILIFIHSAIFSLMPDISILKIISWAIMSCTLISAWGNIGVVSREFVINKIFSLLLVLAAISLPLLFIPLGYLRNGHGFQGVFNHPQAFGPTMALLATWVAAKIIMNPKPKIRSYIILLGVLVLIIKSEARTAGLALFLSLTLSVIYIAIFKGKYFYKELPGLFSKRNNYVMIFSTVTALMMLPILTSTIDSYINKTGRERVSNIADAYSQSRGGLIDKMLDNIDNNLVTGIGFGIASEPSSMIVNRDPLLGLPLGAPIEKGVMLLAVLEELGIILFVLAIGWIIAILYYATFAGVSGIALVGTAILLNFGESVLFSPGGMGSLYLVLITWAFTSKEKFSSFN